MQGTNHCLWLVVQNISYETEAEQSHLPQSALFPAPLSDFSEFINHKFREGLKKKAGAELCQAQVKLEVKV